jgi:glycogen operon protein
MLLMGDEVRRTQEGNNNAYCQDNETSWFDWTLLDKHSDLFRFVKGLIHFRLGLSIYRQARGLSLVQLLRQSGLRWHGVKLNWPDWSHHSHSLAFSVQGQRGSFHLILNAYWEPLEFQLPPPPPGSLDGWRRVIDTALESPEDFCPWNEAPVVEGSTYPAQPRSVVLLLAAARR